MRRRLLALSVVTVMLLSGCAVTSGASSSSENSRHLTWGWNLPSSWDPVTSTAGWDVHALALVYSGLTQLSPNGTVEPSLAQSWQYNTAGDKVTFTLRPSLTFSDGTPLDATAVKSSLERGRDQSNSTQAGQLKVITSIIVADATHVTLDLDQADYQIPLLLSGRTGFIVNPTAAKKDLAGLATKPAGSGPFVLTDYVPSAHADLVKNKHYWNQKHIFIDDVTVKPVTDPSVVVGGVQSGQFDLAVVPPSQVQNAKSAGLRVDVINALTVRVFDVNNTVAPFNNPKVLQAISRAIDRNALIKQGYFGEGTPNWQPFPKGYVAHDPELDNLYPFDQTQAKTLLKEAGHPNGISVALGIAAADSALAEVLQAQLAAADITVKLEVIPPANNNYITRQYPFVLDSFSGRESPLQALEVLYGPTGLMNLGRNAPASIQTAVDKARATPLDSPHYAANIQAAVKAAVTTMPNTFLFTWPRILIHKQSVTGIQHYLATQRFEDVHVGQ